MNFITMFNIVMPLVPFINSFIKQAETFAEEGKPITGKQKLEWVVGAVKAIYEQTAQSKEVPFEKIAESISTIVSVTVNTYNAIGVFVKAIKAAA